jgi:hypothetical protein
MATIRPALMAFFGGIPYIGTYRQMAITKTKAKDHVAALHWCRRGLDVYGAEPLESEGTTDLSNRLQKLLRKTGSS